MTVSFVILNLLSLPICSRPQGELIPASTLISTMLARYHNAKTLSASIHMTQSAMNTQLSFDTALVYERPQKIFLVQKKSNDPSYSRQVISDTVEFIYTMPPNLDNKRVPYLRETSHPPAGQLNIEEMWANLKPQMQGGDDSFALAALISRRYDLASQVPQMFTYLNKGKVQIGNRMANDIEGVWKSAGYRQTGTYQIYITDEGDLVRQVVELSFSVSAQWLVNHKISPTAFSDGIKTTTVWDVSAAVDQPVNQNLFHLPAR